MIDANRYRSIRFERQGPVLTVVMDNPPVNSANLQLHDELSTVFADLEHDECQIVVLTGAGRAFSAGGDMPGMLAACDDSQLRMDLIKRAPYIIESALALSKPLIAKVNGHAMGLGATLALVADVAIATDTAKIADPHVAVGLSAGDGGALLWPLLIGFARARHHLLTGEVVLAPQAVAMGLIYKAVSGEQLDAEVDAYVQRLLALPPVAVNATKRSINTLLRQFATSVADAHAGLEHLTMASADHREAVLSFMEKRKPVFTGR